MRILYSSTYFIRPLQKTAARYGAGPISPDLTPGWRTFLVNGGRELSNEHKRTVVRHAIPTSNNRPA